ncbi:TetR/AcrR family transcriptional regulator [Citreimonas sp.]|uniref:TetR/AcrR family transcriptional regulator n=1 Tax=Citreimonas sp. TaxID=3036715 RepID=UPI0035C82F5A
MAGLREKQKADRRGRILRAAVARFRSVGYRAARIEDLAEQAQVSVGTVYNYYRTKGDILIATVALEVEEVLESGAALLAEPPEGALDAIRALVFGYYDHSLNYLSKEMWRSAMALSIEAPETPNGARYSALDAALAAQVTDMIAALQARGELRRDLDAGAMGKLMFNGLNQEFVDFVKDDAMTLAQLRARIDAQLGPLVALMEAT